MDIETGSNHQYDCCICLETLTFPKTLQCNHFLCKECYMFWKNHQASHHEDMFCPICKNVEISYDKNNENNENDENDHGKVLIVTVCFAALFFLVGLPIIETYNH